MHNVLIAYEHKRTVTFVDRPKQAKKLKQLKPQNRL
jgi:hypothetical protein